MPLDESHTSEMNRLVKFMRSSKLSCTAGFVHNHIMASAHMTPNVCQKSIVNSTGFLLPGHMCYGNAISYEAFPINYMASKWLSCACTVPIVLHSVIFGFLGRIYIAI